jgi:hypothetical protein
MFNRLKHVGFVSTYTYWKLQSENTDIFYLKEDETFIFHSEYFVEVRTVYIKDSLHCHRSLIEQAIPKQRNGRLSLYFQA